MSASFEHAHLEYPVAGQAGRISALHESKLIFVSIIASCTLGRTIIV